MKLVTTCQNEKLNSLRLQEPSLAEYKSGNTEDQIKVKQDLHRRLVQAKKDYRDKLEKDINNCAYKEELYGVNKITGYKPRSRLAALEDVMLPN